MGIVHVSFRYMLHSCTEHFISQLLPLIPPQMIAKGKDCSDLFPAVVKNVVSKNSEVIANKTYKYHSLTKECPPPPQ